MSHIFKLVRADGPSGHWFKKREQAAGRQKSAGTGLLDCPNTHKSIGNEFPLEKHVGAVLRGVIRVVIPAENDLLEVVSDSDADHFSRQLYLSSTSHYLHHSHLFLFF